MKDLKIEQLLRWMKVSFEYRKEVPLASIGKSTDTTTARFQSGLDQKNLNAMTATLDRGCDLEAPVLHEEKGKLKEILSGNHRITARRNRLDTVTDAYITSGLSESTQKLIQRSANVLDGTDTKDKAGPLAAQMHIDSEVSIKEAAEFHGVSQATVSAYLRTKETRQALAQDGHSFVRKPVHDSMLQVLNNVARHKRGALLQVADFVCSKNLSKEDTRTFGKEITGARDDQEVTETLAKWHKLFSSRGHGRHPFGQDKKFRRHINSCQNFIGQKGFLKSVGKQFDSVEKADLKERITNLVVSLNDIKKRI
jgi:predicted transcriptional regulator